MLFQNVSLLSLSKEWGHAESGGTPEIASGVMTGKRNCLGKINNRKKKIRLKIHDKPGKGAKDLRVEM